MRKFKLDNRKVVAPNASLLCGRGRIVKAGMFFIWNDGSISRMCRSLGRIFWTDNDGADCAGHVCAMVLGNDAMFVYVRWVDPAEIIEVVGEPPQKLTAFFFAPQLAYDPDMLLRLIEYGTMTEHYIDGAPETARKWQVETPR